MHASRLNLFTPQSTQRILEQIWGSFKTMSILYFLNNVFKKKNESWYVVLVNLNPLKYAVLVNHNPLIYSYFQGYAIHRRRSRPNLFQIDAFGILSVQIVKLQLFLSRYCLMMPKIVRGFSYPSILEHSRLWPTRP